MERDKNEVKEPNTKIALFQLQLFTGKRSRGHCAMT